LLIDLTTGFGIDAYFLSKNFEKCILVEQNAELSQLVSHNFSVLGITNCEFMGGKSAEVFLKNFQEMADVIYIDPARRDNKGGKVVRMEDCEPNVVEMMPLLLSKSNQILIKTSPLLDISLAINSLKNCKKIYVIAIENECKELLFHIEKGYDGVLEIETVNISTKNEVFVFDYEKEKTLNVPFSMPLKYIYEPNAAIMKSGAFKTIADVFNIYKLHKNTHLYTSETLISNFPGRVFEVLDLIKSDKKLLQNIIPNLKANLSIRNYPSSVQELKKKLQIKDGGDYYVFGTTLMNEKASLLVCKKH
jgi:hypothetical protein